MGVTNEKPKVTQKNSMESKLGQYKGKVKNIGGT